MDWTEGRDHTVALATPVLAYLAGRYHFSTDQLTAITSDIGYIGGAAGFAYSVYARWGTKKVPVAAAKAAGLAILLVMFGIGSVRAADLPVKAPVMAALPTCTPASCYGWDAGVNLAGLGSNANILGGGLQNSLFQNGGLVGAEVGYRVWNGSFYAGAHVSGYYEVNINALPGQANPKWLAMETVQLGVGLAQLFGPSAPAAASPSQGILANLNSTLSSSLISPYVNFGAAQRDVLGDGWVTGAGAEFAVAAHWNVKAEYNYIGYSNSKNEQITTLGLHYHF